jgi:hypothetical protein
MLYVHRGYGGSGPSFFTAMHSLSFSAEHTWPNKICALHSTLVCPVRKPEFNKVLTYVSPEQRSGLYAGSRIRRFRVRDPLGSDTPGVALVVWP